MRSTATLPFVALLFLSIAISPLGAQRTYATGGVMMGLTVAGAPGYSIPHTVRVPRATEDFQFYEVDSTYVVQTGTGVQVGLHGGYSVTPWFTPYVNLSWGRAGEEGRDRVADVFYSEIGSRLNLALPGVPVVPYVLGAIAYRSISHHRESRSGNTIYIYEGTQQSFSGGATTVGAGITLWMIDLSYQVTTGKPEAEVGRYGRVRTERLALGFSLYSSRFQ